MSQPTSPWPVASLAMAGFTILALGVSIAGRVLSPSIVLDLVALWPLLLLAVPGIVAAILRPGSRLAGSGPIVLLTWVLVGFALHLAAWDGLPSSSADIRTEVGALSESASITLSLQEGEATIRAGEGFVVSMERIGGRTGVPEVRVSGSDPVRFDVAAAAAVGWFRFGGVAVDLPAEPRWAIEVIAPVVSLDLTELQVASLDIAASSGSVSLPEVSVSTALRVVGPVRIVIPDGVPASVTGPARVPDDWVALGGGSSAPDAGVGWRIEVDPEGGSVSITNP